LASLPAEQQPWNPRPPGRNQGEMMKKYLFALFAMATALAIVPAALADTVAFSTVAGQGAQNFNGNLANFFTVNSALTINELGVFNASGSGTITGTIQVGIFDVTTGGTLSTATFTPGSYPVQGYYVYQIVAPVAFTVGDTYEVDAVGFSASDPNGNMNSGSEAPILNTFGGAVTYLAGDSTYSLNTNLALTTDSYNYPPAAANQNAGVLDRGGNGDANDPALYDAGSFGATPEPGSLLLLGTGLLGLAFFAFRRAKSSGLVTKNIFPALLTIAAVLTVSSNAKADTIYTDSASFAAATAGGNTQLVTFPGPASPYWTSDPSTYNVDGITVTSAASTIHTNNALYYAYNGGAASPTNYIVVFGQTADTATITFPASSAFSINLGGGSNPAGETGTITLSDGFIYYFTAPDYVSSGNPLDFFGFVSPTPITSATVTFNGPDDSSTEYGVIGVMSYVTPEPGSLLLLGSGLAGLAGVLRRKLTS
jgi:hypothetical protein